MLFLALVSAVLVTVNGQASDPTKVCLPDVLESDVYSVTNQMVITVAMDFPNKLMALDYRNGNRLVFDLTDDSSISVNDTAGKCQKMLPNKITSTLLFQCLPANAVLMSMGPTYLGLSTAGLEIEGWKVDIDGAGSLRVGLTKATPSVPIIREFTATGATTPDIVIFTNPKTSIADKAIFHVPMTCDPAITVG